MCRIFRGVTGQPSAMREGKYAAECKDRQTRALLRAVVCNPVMQPGKARAISAKAPVDAALCGELTEAQARPV